MKFREVRAVRIPSGTAKKIRYNGKTLWEPAPFRYVSLGDSIAAGHSLDGWSYDTQYGKNGNTETAIVPGCYTDLIRDDLQSMYGKIKATSFARSGDTVADLMAKLDHAIVRNAIERADIVTLCIGANDVLEPAMSYLDQYINGDMTQMNAVIEANIATLGNDAAPNSYMSLFNKLYAINPNAKYAFTTIYNPYKYLHLDESTSGNDYKDGFLGPLMWAVPDEILGDLISNNIRSGLLNTGVVKNLFEKVNELPTWADGYITSLNSVLRSKLAAFGKANFMLADTRAVFEPVPNRTISSPKHYNDLVNVEITSGYNVDKLDWGEFWGNYDWSKVLDGIDAIANEAVNAIISYVILPDVDPHPEWYGQYALERSFMDALGWNDVALPGLLPERKSLARRTITYNAGTHGTGYIAPQTVVALDGMTAYTNIAANAFTANTAGYRFTGWLGSNGVSYSNGQFIGLSGDLTLTAQWNNEYTVTYKHSNDSKGMYGSSDTGHMENYEFRVNRITLAGQHGLTGYGDLGAFSNGPVTLTLPYNTYLEVACTWWNDDLYKSASVDIYLNKTSVSDNGSKRPSGDYPFGTSDSLRFPRDTPNDVAYLAFRLKGNVTVDFTAKTNAPALYNKEAYWDCYITGDIEII